MQQLGNVGKFRGVIVERVEEVVQDLAWYTLLISILKNVGYGCMPVA